MSEHDLLEVVEIERASGLSRWGWDAYHNELRNGNPRLLWVARIAERDSPGDGRRIAGYVVARLIAGELHINNFAVREPYRRAGIGGALVSRLLEEAANCGAYVAFLEVRAGNAAAQALYRRFGFSVVGRRSNYYPDPPEDALIMSLEMSQDA